MRTKRTRLTSKRAQSAKLVGLLRALSANNLTTNIRHKLQTNKANGKKMEKLDGMGWAAGIIAALGGWKLAYHFLNRKASKRKALAEAVRVETDAFMKRYNALEDEIKRLNDKVDNLYKKVHELEDERIALLKRNSELELALKEAQHNLCVRPDDECLKRMPPRDYCRLVKLANGEYDEYYKTANEDEKGDTVPKKPRKGRNARQ